MIGGKAKRMPRIGHDLTEHIHTKEFDDFVCYLRLLAKASQDKKSMDSARLLVIHARNMVSERCVHMCTGRLSCSLVRDTVRCSIESAYSCSWSTSLGDQG